MMMKVVVTILVLLVVTTSSATQPQKLRKASFHRDDRRFKSVGQAEVKAYDCSGSILDACAAPAGTETADQLKTLYVTCLNALKQTYANAMSKWQVGNEVGKRDGLNVYTYGDPQKFNNWKSGGQIKSNVFNIQTMFVNGKETAFMMRSLRLLPPFTDWSNQAGTEWEPGRITTEHMLAIDALDRDASLQTVDLLAAHCPANADALQKKYHLTVSAMKMYPYLYEFLRCKGWGGTAATEMTKAELGNPADDEFASWNAGTQVGMSSAVAFDTTFGFGVYFSANQHEEKGHGTKFWKCPVPAGENVVNLDPLDQAGCGGDVMCPKCIHDNLVNVKMVQPHRAVVGDMVVDKLWNPNDKNSFYNRGVAEKAMKEAGVIMIFRKQANMRLPDTPPYIVDKGVIDFTQCTADQDNV